jgi:hypothetical protein
VCGDRLRRAAMCSACAAHGGYCRQLTTCCCSCSLLSLCWGTCRLPHASVSQALPFTAHLGAAADDSSWLPQVCLQGTWGHHAAVGGHLATAERSTAQHNSRPQSIAAHMQCNSLETAEHFCHQACCQRTFSRGTAGLSLHRACCDTASRVRLVPTATSSCLPSCVLAGCVLHRLPVLGKRANGRLSGGCRPPYLPEG